MLPINRDKVMQDLYDGIAKLSFGDLLLLHTQLGEHIWNCWEHHQQQVELAKMEKEKATQPLEQALPSTQTEH